MVEAVVENLLEVKDADDPVQDNDASVLEPPAEDVHVVESTVEEIFHRKK